MPPKDDRLWIFLSYTRKDAKPVENLYRRLQEAGFYPWMDTKDLLPGERWETVIEQTIETAPFFLACLSHHSINHRGVVQEEIRFALESWRKKLESDIYLIPIKLEDCPVPAALAKFNWVELDHPEGFERLTMALKAGLERLGVIQPLRLRSEPIDNLSEEEVKQMLQANDFFASDWYWMGRGVQHDYKNKTVNGDKIVMDHTTNLTWQQGGLSNNVKYAVAEKYITELNAKKFAGFTDWRLPTLEEAMSLMEAKKSDNDLYIDSVFDETKHWMWTADTTDSASSAWLVRFVDGLCNDGHVGIGGTYVRAVCSGHSSR